MINALAPIVLVERAGRFLALDAHRAAAQQAGLEEVAPVAPAAVSS